MRIGLLTYYWEDNPGQFFQGLSTVNALRRACPADQVEIPDIRPWDQRKRCISLRDMCYRPWRNLHRKRKRRRYGRARQDVPIVGPKVVVAHPAKATQELASRKYDLLVVGSDTTLHLWGDGRYTDNLPPMYWLGDLPDTPRVTLASCSHTDRYEDLSPTQARIMSAAVKKFSFLGVRDELTAELLSKLGPAEGVEPRVIPDPTFSYEVDPEPARLLLNRRRLGRKRPLCGLHLAWPSPVKRQLAALLSQHYEVLDLGGQYSGCTALVSSGPYEWSGLFSHLALHVTTSYHETIFALKQGTPVFTVEGAEHRFDPVSKSSKIVSLWRKLGRLDSNYLNPHLDDVTGDEAFARVEAMVKSYDPAQAARQASEFGAQFAQAVDDAIHAALPTREGSVGKS